MLAISVVGRAAPTYAAATITVTGLADDATVANLAGNNECDLREAIEAANTNSTVGECQHDGSAGQDVINFKFQGPPPYTIMVADELIIEDSVLIDGTSEPNYTAPKPVVVLDGSNAPDDPQAFEGGLVLIGKSSHSTIQGLMIINMPDSGILSAGQDWVYIFSNYIGTDGVSAFGNEIGVQVLGGDVIRVGCEGGPGSEKHYNLISGNENAGVSLTQVEYAMVWCNYIGTDATASYAVPNQLGVVSWDSTVDFIGNTISGNSWMGVQINSAGTNASFHYNRIGTDVTGSYAIPNETGVFLSGPGGRMFYNVVSGNHGNGIMLRGFHYDISGNTIGTDVTGSYAIPNRNGIVMEEAWDNEIGSDDSKGGAGGNVISGNIESGISLLNTSTGNVIAYNLIGTDGTGDQPFTDIQLAGIYVDTKDGTTNEIGTLNAEAEFSGNVISGGNAFGIYHTRGSSLIQGNHIGVSISGLPMPNTVGGIHISGTAFEDIQFNWIGFHSNEKSGGYGIEITGMALPTGVGNCFTGNDIGVYSTNQVDFSSNYWGAPSGPDPIGNGDPIIGPIKVQPFLSVPPIQFGEYICPEG